MVFVRSIRKKIVERLPDDVLYGLVRHPSAVISEYACLGDGTVVMQGSYSGDMGPLFRSIGYQLQFLHSYGKFA